MTEQDPPTQPVYVAPPAPAPVLVPGRRTTLAAAAGVGALRSAGWGRVIGIIIGILGTLFWLPAIAGSGRVADANPAIAYVLLAAHAYTFIVLAFFWRNKPSLA